MKSLIYFGCPPAERLQAEQAFASAGVSVCWADHLPMVVAELQRRELPVLMDLTQVASVIPTTRELRGQRPSALMLAVVDPGRPELVTEAVLAGMADVFTRPLVGARVASVVAREQSADWRTRERAQDMHGVHLYSHAGSMTDIMTLMARASASRAGVIIRAEKGTGRRVVARAIHEGQAGAGLFVSVDCGGVDSDELDLVLFGAPPAVAETSRGLERLGRKGKLFEAQGGTLYLQNVAEASARVQGRLARILRDREAILADTGETMTLDVRAVAGVDPGIDAMVQEGRVREELFRRLATIRVDLPALRDRRDDIPALANAFVRDACARMKVPPKGLSRPALALIGALPWRGNASEMRTLLDAVVSSLPAGRGIALEDVLSQVRLDGGTVAFTNAGTLRQARARFEREDIASVLEQHRGRISDAAKALGIQRTNLYRKMRSLRVNRGGRRDASP